MERAVKTAVAQGGLGRTCRVPPALNCRYRKPTGQGNAFK
jgi:hypothetical protein